MSKYYKAFSVWKSIDGEEKAIRFNCFEILGQNKFCVQSADHFYLPVDTNQTSDFNDQFIELFIEDSPGNRSDLYDTPEEAVISYEKDFLD